MKNFVARHAPLVTSTLSGFDRLVFRGSLLPLMWPRSMHGFLAQAGVRLLDFKSYALGTSERVKRAALAEAESSGRPVRYLESPKISKEDLARRILSEHPLEKPGLICAFTAVEPCMSFEYHRSQNVEERGLRLVPRKCLHIYKYFDHPVFGFMNARLQTWFPFNIQICLNGREWLAKELERRRSQFRRNDNCLTWLGNPELAQRLMNAQLEVHWPAALSLIARRLNPLHNEVFRPCPMDYYWTGYQTEWATDILFKSPNALRGIYPALVRHAMHHFQSPDVMRFLGRKASGNFLGELTSSFKDRAEGVRIKHWVRGNSIKMYDKAGSVLRVETTIARTSDFKVFRPPHDDPKGKLAWKPLRKGVADLHRRAAVSQRANERYLEALAVVDEPRPCAPILEGVAKPVIDGRRFRALRVADADDTALLQAVARGEFAAAGFRNRDIRLILHPRTASASKADQRRAAARVSRQLRLLRAHGVIRKVPKTHRYQLTEKGQLLTATLFAIREANLDQLLKKAA